MLEGPKTTTLFFFYNCYILRSNHQNQSLSIIFCNRSKRNILIQINIILTVIDQ